MDTPSSETALAKGQGECAILTDPHRLRSDMRMLTRAIREQWPIPRDERAPIVKRLQSIVAKTTVSVPVEGGTVDSEFHADVNAISASNVLAKMVGANQKGEEADAKDARLDAGLPTERTEDRVYVIPPPKLARLS